VTGVKPTAWYTGVIRQTPRLVAEHTQLKYDQDNYGDDFTLLGKKSRITRMQVNTKPHSSAVTPFDCNDMKFSSPYGFKSGEASS